jgi:hypothetical protein
MDSFNIPTPGTRFIYTRCGRVKGLNGCVEQWMGTVEQHYIDLIGEHVVVARHQGGWTETFWNGSFAGSDNETIEIVQG